MTNEVEQIISARLRDELLTALLEQHRQAEEPYTIECVKDWCYEVHGFVDLAKIAQSMNDSLRDG